LPAFLHTMRSFLHLVACVLLYTLHVAAAIPAQHSWLKAMPQKKAPHAPASVRVTSKDLKLPSLHRRRRRAISSGQKA